MESCNEATILGIKLLTTFICFVSVPLMSMVVVTSAMMNSTYLLSFALVGALVLMVDSAEVGDDDGYGQRDDEHTAQ